MISFKVEGLKDIQKILDDAGPKHSRNLMRATIQLVASNIAKDAKRRAPRGESGDLKRAIKAKRKKSHPTRPISDVIVEHGKGARYDAYYWRFVEHGTQGKGGQSARPFIGPAAEAARANFEKVLADSFGKKLEQALSREAKRNSK